MTTTKWTAPESAATALTTELNSLASGSISSASSAIDNTTDLYLYMSVELALASLNPTGTPYCNLYLVKSLDGSNFEDLSTSASHEVVAVFPMATGSAAKRIVVANILIPPLQFKLAVENQTNVSLASSGSTLKYRRHYEAQV